MEFDIFSIVTVVIILVLSSSLHEAAHAFAGYRLGDNTAVLHGRLSLNPLRHIDPFLSVLMPLLLWVAGLPIFAAAKPVPFNPNAVKWGEKGAAIVALSGPATNLLLALAVGLPMRVVSLSSGIEEVMGLFVLVNLGFMVFNLLPLPPLDGSRLLYAYAPYRLKAIMQQIESQGLLGIFLLVVLFSSVLSGFIGGVVSTLFEMITGLVLI